MPLVIAETGATASVGSRMQVPVSADRFDRYSRDIRHVQESMLPPIATAATPLAPGGLISALAYRQPVGVVAAIASYNFPLTNMAGKVAPALAMGNTVIMKPAPQDPLAVVELARVLDEVGFPPGVINLVNSQGPEPASVLTTSPDVDMVSFTGSTAVGQRIAAAGGPDHEAAADGARAARAPPWSSRTPTSRGRSPPSARPGPSTPARSARPRPGPSSTGASSTRWSRACRPSPGA